MAHEDTARDQNRITVIMGVTDDASLYRSMLRVDPSTLRLKVSQTALDSSTDSVTAVLSATDNAVLDDIALNQTDASQKSMVVDGSGNIIAATSNALNVSVRNTSIAVTGTFYQTTQPVSIASAQVASGAYASGSIASGAVVDGAMVTIGALADNKSTATDTTAVSVISLLKEISYMEQNPASRAVTGTLTTNQGITTIGHGVKTISAAGTDEALAGSTACKRVIIQAQTDNTGWIAVGATGVDATEATGTGLLLGAGDSVEFEMTNLATIFIDATVNGDGVRFTYFN